MNKKLTPWFPAGVKPARKGVYETTHPLDESETYQVWNGKKWCWCSSTIDGVLDSESCIQDGFYWRGLAEKP